MAESASRPKDAATLILVRDGREVLMGQRHPGHVFLPGHYVFPGGRVDRADSFITPATDLRPEIADRLGYRSRKGRARALALAAVRETFEETGLRLGAEVAAVPRTRSAPWRAFFETGVAPTLDVLDYVARAITPPFRPRRFDARFFVADAKYARGEIVGSGELLNLRWVSLGEARRLTLPRITALVLEMLEQRIGAGATAMARHEIPFIRYRRGRYIFDYH